MAGSISMEREYQDFMLGEDGATLKLNHETRLVTPPAKKKSNKHVGAMVKSFLATLSQDWLGVDDELHAVFKSILNLRERCLATSRRLELLKEDTKRCRSNNSWRGRSYRRKKSEKILNRDDLELALSHSLLQHENMMVLARNLLANVGRTQEALGRRLDEMLVFSLSDSSPETLFVEHQVIECQELFQATAAELYRKQVLASGALDPSVTNQLLFCPLGASSLVAPETITPLETVRTCVAEWPRQHRKSHLKSSRLLELSAAS